MTSHTPSQCLPCTTKCRAVDRFGIRFRFEFRTPGLQMPSPTAPSPPPAPGNLPPELDSILAIQCAQIDLYAYFCSGISFVC